MGGYWGVREFRDNVLEDLPAMLQHFFEIVGIGPEDLHVDFGDAVFEDIAQDFLFFRGEFKVLHSYIRKTYNCPSVDSSFGSW
jgi:hypothetical protein